MHLFTSWTTSTHVQTNIFYPPEGQLSERAPVSLESPPPANNDVIETRVKPSKPTLLVQRRLAWPLRKDDTHKSRIINSFKYITCKTHLACFHASTLPTPALR